MREEIRIERRIKKEEYVQDAGWIFFVTFVSSS
jgi:hypothetical protein